MEILAKIRYGSQNYGLDTPDSDEDFKLIVRPTFDDLYHGRNLNEKKYLPEDCDPDHYSLMDIRKWFELLKKGNFNAIEYLFSNESDTSSNYEFFRCIDCAISLYKDGYLNNVWHSFFKSVYGNVIHALKRDGITYKTLSRAYYVHALIGYLFLNDNKMTRNIWDSPLVRLEARYVRFEQPYIGDVTIEYVEKKFHMLEAAILPTLKEPDENLNSQMNQLQDLVYNYIKGALIKDEKR